MLFGTEYACLTMSRCLSRENRVLARPISMKTRQSIYHSNCFSAPFFIRIQNLCVSGVCEKLDTKIYPLVFRPGNFLITGYIFLYYTVLCAVFLLALLGGSFFISPGPVVQSRSKLVQSTEFNKTIPVMFLDSHLAHYSVSSKNRFLN